MTALAAALTGLLLALAAVAEADTDAADVAALGNLYTSWNGPSQLTGWSAGGGDPCGAAWMGVSCVGSAVTSLKLSSMGLNGTLGYQLSNLQALKTMCGGLTLGTTGSSLTGAQEDDLATIARRGSPMCYVTRLGSGGPLRGGPARRSLAHPRVSTRLRLTNPRAELGFRRLKAHHHHLSPSLSRARMGNGYGFEAQYDVLVLCGRRSCVVVDLRLTTSIDRTTLGPSVLGVCSCACGFWAGAILSMGREVCTVLG
ncbi:hypothetical protein GUJ93_ZPchr0011g27005 [Zizania palustris]|uniref:Leucine-rich repeat-containing N-terminal plant-type domain-containing protein n=1 Tax=Zizania palustris TaxID=103762 RepID=A0A8J5WIW3_ZIZPA|nr:hypothetical protein GUJ93_ZPchr0011g27005 [Zizania palustris]